MLSRFLKTMKAPKHENKAARPAHGYSETTNWFTHAHFMQDVEVFQQFPLLPPDEVWLKTAWNWYGPGVDGAVKVPAKLPPAVVVTVCSFSQM
jgi:hypothetical protein